MTQEYDFTPISKAKLLEQVTVLEDKVKKLETQLNDLIFSLQYGDLHNQMRSIAMNQASEFVRNAKSGGW